MILFKPRPGNEENDDEEEEEVEEEVEENPSQGWMKKIGGARGIKKKANSETHPNTDWGGADMDATT